ncbi:MAG: pyruvate formate lyase family protein [Eubacteriales bacterium]
MADFDINRLPAKPTERVIKAKEMFLEENPEMCCQRAIIYTEVYRNLSGRCPTILLRAKALCRTLEELPIFIQPQEVIVGHSASRPRSAEVFPEVNINFTDEIDQFETRKYNRLRVRPEVRASLLEIAPFWKGNTPHDYLMRQRTAAIQNAYVCGLLSDPHEGERFCACGNELSATASIWN